MKNLIEENHSKIESWLSKKGFLLLKSKNKTIEDEVCFERKVVFLSLRSNPVNQLYSLLHECGHIVVRTKKDYKDKFKELLEVLEGDKKETLRSEVEEVEEEILAWREGFTLAKKLGIEVDENKYYKYSSKWVMSYIVRAAIGNEHHFGALKQKKKENSIDDNTCVGLDTKPEPCYSEVIAPVDEPPTV